jgi:DNA processing protein
MKNLEYLINITLQKGFGTRNINRVLKESPTVDVFKQNITKLFKISNREIEDNFIKIQKLLTKADLCGVKLISYYDKEYPELLREIADSPLILACKGNISLLKSNCISVVGTREPSPYGISITKELCNYLSTQNYTTVSGMAFGIDALVHLNSTQTIAVLPTFPSKPIPVSNSNVYNNILSKDGLIISDNLFEDGVQNYMYVSRNRIIAGLSKKTIVTEAGENSGALITAQYALDYDRESYAIPGNIFAKESFGCNKLIDTNVAKILTNFEDLIEQKLDRSVD